MVDLTKMQMTSMVAYLGWQERSLVLLGYRWLAYSCVQVVLIDLACDHLERLSVAKIKAKYKL